MDAIRRFIIEGLDIRGAVVRLGPAWQALQARRDYAAPERDLLGELAAVTALIGSNLKQPGRITFQLQGHGPVRMLVMDCDEQLRLRGLAKTDGLVVPAPVPQLLGDGRLVLNLQTNAAAHPYQSHVPIEGETLAEMFEHYLAQSEQTPTRLWLAADAHHACGLFLQKLPDADARDADGWNRIQHLAATVRASELTLPAETLLARLFPEETLRLFAPQAVTYHCPRDEEKVLNMLRTLGREEVAEMLEEHDEIVIQDDICNHEYRYDKEVLGLLFPTPSQLLH
ncbi:MAG: Hsp33 family molecular chaperone HslO [Rhodocyclaceae bacterium]|nr:Hsp33 family molecular chaperone HslO [Rhodocyclaceae bacterium]